MVERVFVYHFFFEENNKRIQYISYQVRDNQRLIPFLTNAIIGNYCFLVYYEILFWSY